MQEALQGLLLWWGEGVFDAREGEVGRERAFIDLEVAPFELSIDGAVELNEGRAVQVRRWLVFDAHPDDARLEG